MSTMQSSCIIPRIMDRTQYDTIIVGGGTSGSVLAARLSEDAHRNVLLIERGGDHSSYDDKVLKAERVWDAAASRRFSRTRRMRFPGNFLRNNITVGHTLGGTSAINAMAAVRGQPEDYDAWSEFGCEGWSWQDVLPVFKKLENDLDFQDTKLHSSKGPLPLRRWRPAEFSLAQHALYQGVQEMGVKVCDDVNDRSKLPGVGVFPGTTRSGTERVTVSLAYLTPEVRQRANLTIVTDCPVGKVEFGKGPQAKRVIGVRTQDDRLILGKEVIVSCGALGSPQLLLLSGVGPQEELARHQIPPVHDLPGVGRNMQEHVGTCLIYRGPYEEEMIGSPAKILWADDYDGNGDINFHISAAPVRSGPIIGTISAVPVYHMLPTTRGAVTLNRKNPHGFPDCDLNFLTHPQDLAALQKIVARVLEWEQTRAFKDWGAIRLFPRPTPNTLKKVKWAKQIKTISYFHAVGTCAMGSVDDSQAVLDSQCRVHGIEGLRVVDASSMPRIIRGNTYLCCTMFAERVAEFMNK